MQKQVTLAATEVGPIFRVKDQRERQPKETSLEEGLGTLLYQKFFKRYPRDSDVTTLLQDPEY